MLNCETDLQLYIHMWQLTKTKPDAHKTGFQKTEIRVTSEVTHGLDNNNCLALFQKSCVLHVSLI